MYHSLPNISCLMKKGREASYQDGRLCFLNFESHAPATCEISLSICKEIHSLADYAHSQGRGGDMDFPRGCVIRGRLVDAETYHNGMRTTENCIQGRHNKRVSSRRPCIG